MLQAFSDNAIYAKCRSFFGERLTPADYGEMMKKSSVSEVAACLKESTHYRDVLSGADEGTIHRGQLENLLRNEKFRIYERIIQYDARRDGDFYHYIYLREEIDQLINLLMYLSGGCDGEYFYRYSDYLKKHCAYDLDRVVLARSFDQLLEILAGTQYAKILEKDRPEGEDRFDLAACERNLNTYYYRSLLDTIDKEFSGETRRALHRLFLERIDAENIAGAYRLRRFFKNTPDSIRLNLLPFETPSRKLIDDIIASGTPAELEQVLRHSQLGEMMEEGDIQFIENITHRLRNHLSKRYIWYSSHPPVVMVALMTQLDLELENLINIIESIRYGLVPAEMKNLLVI